MEKIILFLILLLICSCSNMEYEEDVSADMEEMEEFPMEMEEMTREVPPIYENDYYGDINYILQDTMIVGEITTVNVTISNNVQIDEIISDVEIFTDDGVFSEVIRIAPMMNVRLIDPVGDNFTIISITSEQQFLENDEYTLWKWNVISLKKGNHKLILSVDVVFGNKFKTIKVYESFIHVHSDETIWNYMTLFVKENWKWFLSTLLIPLFIYFYKKRKRK